jgi:hypothetical protein
MGTLTILFFCCVEFLAGGASKVCPGKEALSESTWDILHCLVSHTDRPHTCVLTVRIKHFRVAQRSVSPLAVQAKKSSLWLPCRRQE